MSPLTPADMEDIRRHNRPEGVTPEEISAPLASNPDVQRIARQLAARSEQAVQQSEAAAAEVKAQVAAMPRTVLVITDFCLTMIPGDCTIETAEISLRQARKLVHANQYVFAEDRTDEELAAMAVALDVPPSREKITPVPLQGPCLFCRTRSYVGAPGWLDDARWFYLVIRGVHAPKHLIK